MKQSVNNVRQLLNHPFGGQVAKRYIAPRIEIIFIDNEISLVLASNPPIGPSESFNFNQNNPFKPKVDLV